MDKKEYDSRIKKMKSINSKFDKTRFDIESDKKEHERLIGVYSFMPDNDAKNMSFEGLKELDDWYAENYPEQRDGWIKEYEHKKSVKSIVFQVGAGLPTAPPMRIKNETQLTWWQKALAISVIGVALPMYMMKKR